MRILGIDPGSGSTGYGIIESDGSKHAAVLFGTIKTGTRRPFHERLLKIHVDLSEILAHEKVDVMAIENVFHAANVQSALKLGHARGVALLVAAQQKIPVCEYSPLEVKAPWSDMVVRKRLRSNRWFSCFSPCPKFPHRIMRRMPLPLPFAMRTE